MPLHETDIVRQVYVADNGVGPCLMTFDDGAFVDWWPCLTFERTQDGRGA